MNIKFRAWDKTRNKMLYWNDIKKIGVGNILESEDYIAMQCLNPDSKSKYIYECDIVKWHHPSEQYEAGNIGYVTFSEHRKGFVWKDINCSYYEYHMGGKDFMVIGNLFENDELILKHSINNNYLSNYAIDGFRHAMKLNVEDYNTLRVTGPNNGLLLEKKPQHRHEKETLMRIKSRKKTRAQNPRKKEDRYYQIYLEIKEKLESNKFEN